VQNRGEGCEVYSVPGVAVISWLREKMGEQPVVGVVGSLRSLVGVVGGSRFSETWDSSSSVLSSHS
jgi:hypothetical protein